MKIKKINIIILSIICMCVCCLFGFNTNKLTAYAISPTESIDGKYTVDFDTSIPNNPMMRQVFENGKAVAVVEKIKDNYYLTISLNSDVMKDFKFHLENKKVGEIITYDSNIERHTFSITKETLENTMNFSLIVTAGDMNMYQKFTIDLKLKSGNRIGEVDKIKERPALFVPTINVNASDVEMETGSYYIVKDATALIGTDELEVIKEVYYIEGGERKPVEIKDNKILLSKIGEYELIYRAESDKYKTSLGNNTFSEKIIKISSKVGATELVKIEDENKILPEGYMISSSYINNGEIYDKAKDKMKKIADNFEVVSFELYKQDGEKITLTEKISVCIRSNDYYDRHEIVVYHMDENGDIEKINVENYGRYSRIQTEKTGAFIICVPGVAFHMPIWGYALIGTGGVVIVVALIVTIVVLAIKKKKKNKENTI